MNNKLRKSNKISVFCAFIVLVALCFVIGLSSVTAQAGNITNDSSTDCTILTMDANGRVADISSPEINSKQLAENDKYLYKTRFLDVNALLSAYCGKNTDKDSNLYNATNFALSKNNIFLANSNYLEVEPAVIETTNVKVVKITAKSKYDNVRITFRFLRTVAGENAKVKDEMIDVYFKINVSSGTVIGNSNSGVLNDSNRTVKVKLGEGIGNTILLPNKNRIEIPLSEKLIGKELYVPGSTSAGDTLVKNVDGSAWTFSDVKNLKIASVKVENDIIPSSRIFYTNTEGLYDPVIVVNVLFTEETVNANKIDVEGKGKCFWGEDGAYFNLTITLECPGASNPVSVQYKVAFTPGSRLSIKKTLGMPNELNATSSYSYSSTEDKQYKDFGYNKVLVRVSDITDYPTFDTTTKNYKQNFRDNDQDMPSDTTNTVGIKRVKLANNEVAYEVSGISNGEVVLTFKVYYKDINGDPKNIDVNVTFIVYGKYSVDFLKLEGKSKKSYNINSSKEFEQLKKAYFRLEKAEIVNTNEKDTTLYATAQVKDGYLNVSPLISGAVNIKLTFINSSGQYVVVNSPLVIDIESGNIFNTWEMWQIILLIVGCSIALIILILFIIWIFIRSISKNKQDELESSAPTSSYIIKLNSTIAAAQAQQRLATTQAFAAQTQMLQLGAGPVTQGATGPNTLQLSSAGVTPPTQYSIPAGAGATMTMPPNSDINITNQSPAPEEIYIPISDEELIERIFVEKYEPRGMARRSFFKSKDLQTKELEKEKSRIREEVRAGKSIEDACKSQKQREDSVVLVSESAAPIVEEENQNENVLETKLVKMLGFNPSEPIVIAEEEAFNSEDMLPEEVQYKRTQNQCVRLEELKKICLTHTTKIDSELVKTKSSVDKDNSDIEIFENDIKKKQDSITDIEIKMATAKNKEKEKYAKDLAKCESDIAGANKQIAKLQTGLEEKNNIAVALTELLEIYNHKNTENDELIANTKSKLAAEQEILHHAKDRALAAQKMQENDRKANMITPLMRSANIVDRDIRALEETIENDIVKKDECKSKVSAMQTQLLGTTDVAVISNLSANIAELNKHVSELDKAITANTKSKTDKNIELTGLRRKCNDLIEKENMETEHVVEVEDKIIGEITLESMVKQNETDLEKCEKDVATSQMILDDLTSSADAKLLAAAGSVAEAVRVAESDVAKVEEELNELNSKMEDASDDDKLMLSIDQMSLSEKIAELTSSLDEIKAKGIKANLEIKVKNEAEIEDARKALEMAKSEYDKALERHNNASTASNPLDLITSGSGIISQDRQKIETANLKKQLEKSKNALEQANLQAKMAQMEAEKAIIDAQRASQASKEEAERLAHEAIAKAEQAKQEAGAKAAEEAKKAFEEAEEAKRKAEEEAQKVREEVEQTKRKVEEDAEAMKAKMNEDAEAMKARMNEEQQAALRAIEDEKQKHAEEAAALEAKRVEEERKKAEADAIHATKVAEKINKRKNAIVEMRQELSSVKNEDMGRDLYEKFYATSLDFDEDEKNDNALNLLITKSMDDALHAGEVKHYQSIADKAPKRIVKKVTEKVNKIQRPPSRNPNPNAARPAGARPAAPGTRPVGARPAAPGTRPTGARPTGARPAPGSQPRPPRQ